MKNRKETKKASAPRCEKTQRLLVALGAVCCFFLLGCAARQLLAAPAGSFGALERRVGAYIEHALSCFVIPCISAAALEWIENRGTY